ncbi:hypothetical protein CTI12_AA139540 [Artemisia annua]|uniref:Protein preY, mitochondrial n=1 Tax=Artemisia annua TaxID=35608 RepID=A0A2U1PLB8_ARTAN|nr:hypothetical protein CTI12_AA139540 [Artemisia annua]
MPKLKTLLDQKSKSHNGEKKVNEEKDIERKSSKMVGGSSKVVEIMSKTLSQILVCPLSKQPLRICEKSNSLISDAIGVSFPIVDGIPCLVPKDGKIIENDDTKGDHQDDTSS